MKLKSFDKNSHLGRLHRRKNKDRLIMLSTMGLSIVILIISIVFFAYARYEVQKNFTLMNATVGDFQSGDFVIAAYVDGSKSKSIPQKDSGYYLQKVECENGATGTWDSNSWELTVANATSQTKCYVYFTTLLAEADTTGLYSTLSKYYPVGSIYQSVNSTSPATLFGGTWEQITNTMLMAQGSSFTLVNSSSYSSDGGSSTVSLTPANLPNHTHTYTPSGSVTSSFTGTRSQTEDAGSHYHSANFKQIYAGNNTGVIATYATYESGTPSAFTDTTPNHKHYYTPSGSVKSTFAGSSSSTTGCTNCSGTSVSVLNPYKVVYMWVRTS